MTAGRGPSAADPPARPVLNAAPALRRSIGPFQLFAYTLGGMLGAGIYGLVGRAAEQLGAAVWLGFAVAMIAALLTGLPHATLGSRYPQAGGAAYVVHRGWKRPLLTWAVGLAVISSGLTSVATQSRVVAENLSRLLDLPAVPPVLISAGFLLLVTLVVFRGIRESMWINVVCTAVEAAGLVLVILVGLPWWGTTNLLETADPAGIGAVLLLQGAVLAFFAFIGFEDTLNVAEECKDPQRSVPLGIISAMIVAALLYMAVAVTAVSVVPWRELAAAPGRCDQCTAFLQGCRPWHRPGLRTSTPLGAGIRIMSGAGWQEPSGPEEIGRGPQPPEPQTRSRSRRADLYGGRRRADPCAPGHRRVRAVARAGRRYSGLLVERRPHARLRLRRDRRAGGSDACARLRRYRAGWRDDAAAP